MNIFIGTGKSKLMRSIADIICKRHGVGSVTVLHDVRLSKYVGEGEHKLREYFKTAQR
jgi:SpoVK/Ycf46/Vps4 family AAA+-type ATPase